MCSQKVLIGCPLIAHTVLQLVPVVHGRNVTLVRYPQFLRLVQVGLPNRLRGEIWELTSGSIYMRFANPGVYESILKAHEGQVSTSTEEIEKDLNRSLPEYAGYQTPEGIEVRAGCPASTMNCAAGVLTIFGATDATKSPHRVQLEESGAWLLSGNEHCCGCYLNVSGRVIVHFRERYSCPYPHACRQLHVRGAMLLAA